MERQYKPNFQVLKYIYIMVTDEKRKTTDENAIKNYDFILESLNRLGYNFNHNHRPKFTLDRNQQNVIIYDEEN